ncbi:MAG: TonB-dependent receptor [Bacteroidales bacterium]|nr:TonB-dependent receptor [Bacteroidales bacterium]
MKRFISSFILILLGAALAFAQDVTVTGTVVSRDDGYPLPGVSVLVKGTVSQGTFTDLDGNFSIDVPQGSILSISSIGFETKELEVTHAGHYDITLNSDAEMLDEVVAIGYGVMKKSDLTGSLSSVKADALQRTPAANMDQALQGLAAGVTVNASSGQPGAAAEVRIRGIGTVNNSAPIYVVDGVIVDDISFVSPSDIESTEILKDASATAIYGSRGANGVILVTTKKGSTDGRVNVSIDMYAGVQTVYKTLDLMKSQEFAETLASMNSATQLTYLQNNGLDKWLRNYYIGSKSAYYPSNMDYGTVETDWQDVIFRSAPIQNYHVSISGGNDKSQWAISGGYFSQQGTIIGSDYHRGTFRANSSHQVAKWLKVGENMSFVMNWGTTAMNNNSSPAASVISAALAMAPWDPARYPSGAVNSYGDDLSGQISAASNFKNVTNPLSMVENSYPEDKTERIVGDVFLELNPIKGLTFRSDCSLDLTFNRYRLFDAAYEYSSYDKMEKNFISRSMTRYSTVIVENTLTYARDIKKHSFSAMVGQTTEQYSYYSIGGSGSSILNPDERNWYIAEATEDVNEASDSASRSRRLSFLGRLYYNFDGRYLVTVNFRADGSSKFPENTWGFFPSAALAWRLSKESWMKGAEWLDDLKIRAGWGRIGNDQIGDNAFVLSIMNTGPTFVDYPLGTGDQSLASGATILTYINNGGKWETTEQWDAGLDFGVLKNKLTGTLDLFLRDTKDMLMSVTAPAHVGNRYAATANVGTVRNKGIELTLEHRNTAGDFNYSISGNISFINNELTGLNGGARIYGDRTICDEGLALYTFYGYKYLGIYQSDEEAKAYLPNDTNNFSAGDCKFEDLNGDGLINEDDRTALGNPFPWLTGGLNFSCDWKGIDLTVFFQGVYGNEIYNATRLRTEGTGNESTLSTSMRNVWTSSNPNGTIANPNGSPMNKEDSSRYVEDGSYLRLKNLQIGYSFPTRWIEKAGMSRLRIYLSGSNLFTLTKYTGYDPEVGGGVDYGNYPQSRTFMVGLNINF